MKAYGRSPKAKMIAKRSVISLVIGASLGFSVAHAATFEEAVSKAVRTHPDVVSKWRSIQAAAYERDVAWGRYMPTLDVMYGTADERRNAPVLPLGTDHYSTEQSKASLKWNLFEGFATLHDTKRLEHATLVRYYELLDLSETAASEAAKAYVDFYRYRNLVAMAEENYAIHRLVFEKVGARTKSGVGRGVDLEMAAARLALAESNLLTEASNMHDVSARYQRIVGENPAGEVSPPTMMAKGLPKSRVEAVQTGFKDAPSLKAAVQNILSSQRNIDVQRSGYYPRVDAYADKLREKNTDGIDGITNTDTVGVMVTMNLFRGWQDDSRVGKAVAESSMAKETRERVCRDLRQNLSMAYNDHLRLTEQLAYLDQHQLSSGKSVEAMRRQFDIGQRSLLDVLDTENEYYQARRNYLNGEMDLLLAQTRYHAAAGSLLKTLNLKALEFDPPTPETELDEDARNQCPPEPAEYPTFDKEAVYARAKAREDLMRGQAREAADKEQAASSAPKK